MSYTSINTFATLPPTTDVNRNGKHKTGNEISFNTPNLNVTLEIPP